jgi:N utilization substance protein A
VKDDGILESFELSLEEAQTLIMNARIACGMVDPADFAVAAEDESEEG